MEAIIYNQKGAKSGSISLPENIFGLKWNADLVHQVIQSMRSNQRSATAHTKDRGEVSGGGKKPWQQKGTGRARHGSSRSPLWKGGGVTHGPRNEKNYEKTISRKMKAKALFTILSAKQKEGKILFVEDIALADKKTKDAEAIMKSLTKVPAFEGLTHPKAKVYLALPKRDENVEKSFQNLPYVYFHQITEMDPLSIANARYVVIVNPGVAVEVLGKKVTK